MGKQRRLGKGLDALLSNASQRVSLVGSSTEDKPVTNELAVSALEPGRFQPRQEIREESLTELADSIRQQGVLQPLVVRPIARPVTGPGQTTHEIVAGERRWRAAQIAGRTTVPVVVRNVDDQSALAIGLIENLQREDLNPIELANSLSRLVQEFELTHQQIADAVGRSRSSVSNFLRLLELHGGVRELLESGGIDMGHARALLPLAGDKQLEVAQKAAARGLSVRQVEQAVTALLAAPADSGKADPSSADMQTLWLQKQLAKELGQKVAIRTRKDGSRKLDIDFKDLEQLQASLQKIEVLIGRVRSTAGPRVRESQN